MNNGIEQTSNTVFLTQHLHQLHLTLGDRISEAEASAIAALEAELSRESANSLTDAAVQLMLASSTLQLVGEKAVSNDRNADIERVNALILSALRVLEKEVTTVLIDCGIDFFIGTNRKPKAAGEEEKDT
jgi:hypothetical protein